MSRPPPAIGCGGRLRRRPRYRQMCDGTVDAGSHPRPSGGPSCPRGQERTVGRDSSETELIESIMIGTSLPRSEIRPRCHLPMMTERSMAPPRPEMDLERHREPASGRRAKTNNHPGSRSGCPAAAVGSAGGCEGCRGSGPPSRFGEEAMTEVRPAETAPAGRAVARRIDRREVVPKPGMPEPERPCGGEDRRHTPVPGRQDAVEHVHPGRHRHHDVPLISDPHEVSRPIRRESRRGEFHHFLGSSPAPLPTATPPIAYPGKVESADAVDRRRPEIEVGPTLDDPEQRLLVRPGVGLGRIGPASGWSVRGPPGVAPPSPAGSASFARGSPGPVPARGVTAGSRRRP